METEVRMRVDQPVDLERSLARANALNASGFLESMQFNYEQSQPLLEESLRIFKGLGQAGRRGMAISLLRLAEVVGNTSEQIAHLEESLAIFREIRDKFYIAECLQQIGGFQVSQGHFTEAKRAIEENLALRKELGDQDGLGTAYTLLGYLAITQGDYNLAKEMYKEGQACYQAVNNIRFSSQAFVNLAELSWAQGDYDQATRYCEEAITTGTELGSRQIVGNAYSILGMVAWASGDYDLAQKRSKDELAIGQETGILWLKINALYIRGKIALSQKNCILAYEMIREIFTLFPSNYLNLQNVYFFLLYMAILAAAWNRLEVSAQFFSAAEHVYPWANHTMSPAERAERDNTMATVRVALGDEAFAIAWAAGQTMTAEQALESARGIQPGP
jgi:tetratricopeptide (TPR) repeat protein